ncbi:MAG TPA: hypothetical protein VMD29_00330, partial [Terracidiphilus sp.]|nr:hypothetical protein [Terracidiphilus sp.]
MRFRVLLPLLVCSCALSLSPRDFAYQAQSGGTGSPARPAAPAQTQRPRVRPNDAGAALPTRFDMLRGAYGPFRANNDLLYYHLDIRVDPSQKSIAGKNTIRFRMLKDGTRIQLDLTDKLNIDKILWHDAPLKYERDTGAVFVDFPRTLKTGEVVTIEFYYSGHPPETGRFGAFTFKQDAAGRTWINTACEETGASIWWPNKDQWRDEVESMDISVAVPNGLTDVSNGHFVGKTDLG